MTREEAVIILDGFKNNPLFSDTHVQAFDMAISALKKNESAEEWYKLLCEKWDEGDWICHAPKGMTNGDVMNLVLRKTFPRIIFIRGINEWNKTKSIVYSEEWENAPYKAEKGGE